MVKLAWCARICGVIMTDKYSKIEEKMEEGNRRVGVIEKTFEVVLALDEVERQTLLSWEMVVVKENKGGVRLNIIEVVGKSSSVRFILNQKKSEIEKRFGEEFLDNEGKREVLSLRIK